MAPDLNSVPPSPRPLGSSTTPAMSTTGSAAVGPRGSAGSAAELYHISSSPSLSRRVSPSWIMGPPPAPQGTLPTASGVVHGAGDNVGVGIGPGPLRHPQPLSIADLHLELEKEQEAVVNRLTRELSVLRQQTASVASTNSSTSASFNDQTDLHVLPGASQPLHARDRSSSTLSSRSQATSQLGNITGSMASLTGPRDGGAPLPSRPSMDRHRSSFSREAPEPQPHSSILAEQLRAGPTSSPQTTSRYEEVAHHRAELESVRRENETLRRRVRELETMVRQHRRPRERTESATTTSSLASGLRDAEITDGAPSREPDSVS